MSDDVEDAIKVAESLVRAIRDLGTGDANTPMGAIEFDASEIRDASERIMNALGRIADAMRSAGLILAG